MVFFNYPADAVCAALSTCAAPTRLDPGKQQNKKSFELKERRGFTKGIS